MCCFRLDFVILMCYFFKKNLLQVTFDNMLFKKREKNNLSPGKIPDGYQMVRPL